MKLVLIALCFLITTGCSQTKVESQAVTEKNDTVSVEGTITVPPLTAESPALPLPINLTITRKGNELQTGESNSKTEIDSGAIAQQVGTAVSKSVSTAIAGLTGVRIPTSSPPSGGISATEGGLGAGTIGMLLLLLREYMARRKAEKDSDEGWDIAIGKKPTPDTNDKPSREHA